VSEFDSYVDRMLDEVRAPGVSEREIASRVRELTEHALRRPPFVVECAERVISAVGSMRGADVPPLWGTRSTPATLRIFYWPPGLQNEPHQHDAWGVTGVVFNEIIVETFPATTPPLESPQRCEPSRSITARAGDVGYLIPPCVHRLRNETARTTITFHVFGAESETSTVRHAPRVVHERNVRRGVLLRRRVLCAWCDVLAELSDARSVSLLERIVVLTPDPLTKLQAIKSLARHDPRRAYELSCDFEKQLLGADRHGLSLINARLAGVWADR
jgi:hypothetical protein